VDARRPVTFADLTPVRMVRGDVAQLPGTPLTVELIEWLYGHGATGLVGEVTLRIAHADGRTTQVTWPAWQTHEIFGVRLHLEGDAGAVFVYVLPPLDQ
jgi:hypothetical protein